MRNDYARSMARAAFAARRATFVNLQYGDCVEDLAAVRRETGIEIHDWTDADPLVDMDAFAAKVAALDLVVSVDNSTVHLSGALGVPTWVLLPHVPGWRWTIAMSQSLVSEFAAISPAAAQGDWAAVFEQVRPVPRQIAIAAITPSPGMAANNHLPEKVAAGLPWVCDCQSAELPTDGATSAETGWAPTIAPRSILRAWRFRYGRGIVPPSVEPFAAEFASNESARHVGGPIGPARSGGSHVEPGRRNWRRRSGRRAQHGRRADRRRPIRSRARRLPAT